MLLKSKMILQNPGFSRIVKFHKKRPLKFRFSVKTVFLRFLCRKLNKTIWYAVQSFISTSGTHTHSVNVQGSLFVGQILLKITKISAYLWYFEEFEYSISQKEGSITPFGQFWCIKWSLTIWFGFLFLRVKLQDWGTCALFTHKVNCSRLSTLPAGWKVSKAAILTSF